jgi:hypothetical protein
MFPFDNNMSGETYGTERATQRQIRPHWRLNASYSWLDNQHREFLPDFINTRLNEVERSIYGRVTWNF